MKIQIYLILFLLHLTTSNAQTWSSGTNIPEAIRAGNSATYSKDGDGYLLIASGRNQDGVITPRHQKYQLGTNSWTDLAPHPTGVLGASTAIVKDTMYVIGGVITTPGTAIRKVRKYSINENTWTDAANFPVNIVDSDAVAYQDSLIYVAAGYSNRVRVFNTITNTWRLATSFPTSQTLSWGALTVVNNTLVYMCGSTGFQSPNYFNNVRVGVIDQTNRANITWTEATPFPGITRTFFDAHPWGNGIIMTGGSTDNTFNTNSDECFYYNVTTDTWTPLPSKPTSWITGNSGSVQIGDTWKLICASGYGSPGYLYQTEIYTDEDVMATIDLETKKQFLKLQPNPAKDILTIQTQDKIKEINVYNVLGGKVKAANVSENSIDVAALAKGVYIINVVDESETTFTSKFIKE